MSEVKAVPQASTNPDVTTGVAQFLAPVVIDLTALAVDGKQAHWHVRGENFQAVHELLDAVVDHAHDYADTAAERVVALGLPIDARIQTVGASATTPKMSTGFQQSDTVIAEVIAAIDATLVDRAHRRHRARRARPGQPGRRDRDRPRPREGPLVPVRAHRGEVAPDPSKRSRPRPGALRRCRGCCGVARALQRARCLVAWNGRARQPGGRSERLELVVREPPAEQRRRDRHRAQAHPDRRACGSASVTTRSAGCPTSTVVRVDASRASATVIRCSGCHGSRPSRVRPTAAAIVTHGSSGATGASEPNRRRAPASSSDRNAYATVRAPRPVAVGDVAVVDAGARAARWPRRRARRTAGCRARRAAARARSVPRPPTVSNASSASEFAWSPMACTSGTMPFSWREPHERDELVGRQREHAA